VWLLLVCLSGLRPAVAAVSPLVLSPGESRFPSYAALRHFCTPSDQSPSARALLSRLNEWPWQPSGPDVPNYGFSQEVCWLHLVVKNEGHTNNHWFLVANYPLIEELDVHVVAPDGHITASHATGSNRPFWQRALPVQAYAFPFELRDGQTLSFLLRVHTPSLQLPLEVIEPDHFAGMVVKSTLLQGVFLGGMVVMILYNLFLYASLREPAYLLYVLYSVVITLIQADNHG
jgi:hypothetical protein